MAPEHYKTIAIVPAMLSSLHSLCALLMIGSSVWSERQVFSRTFGLSGADRDSIPDYPSLPNELSFTKYAAQPILRGGASSKLLVIRVLHGDEPRKPFTSLACDCALDLLACMGVAFIVVMSYIDQYGSNSTEFQELLYRSWRRGNRVAALSNATPISPKQVKVKTVANKSGVKSSKLTIEPTSCNQVSYFETEFRQHDQ
ncbi:hypothetical protein GQ600_14487 [Phytophthora cactorum]|nr:hypothetical protein GQ600_14487 [Phytophthora cactorum]